MTHPEIRQLIRLIMAQAAHNSAPKVTRIQPIKRITGWVHL